MNGEFFNKKKVLVAPLDWGLGHATRCIPVINKLLANSCTVFIAAEGAVKTLLQNEFPQLQILPIKGYNISYSRQKWWLPFKMFLQIPKIKAAIKYENQWLEKIIEEHEIDIVISDNRFGLYNKNVYCIYITHQLLIKTGNRFLEKLLQKKNYRYINRFNECWVPDNEKENILAGELSHPEKMPLIKTVYIGPLSRFEKREEEKIYNLLIILSGPEPQRSILEKIILHQAVNSKKNILLVKGRPDEKQTATQRNNLTIVNHLSSTELNKALQQSKMVICRSGYSSIMDLYAIKQNAILIPTPGQTEQEYLAKWLMNKRLFYSVPQKNFEMKKAIREALLFYGEN